MNAASLQQKNSEFTFGEVQSDIALWLRISESDWAELNNPAISEHKENLHLQIDPHYHTAEHICSNRHNFWFGLNQTYLCYFVTSDSIRILSKRLCVCLKNEIDKQGHQSLVCPPAMLWHHFAGLEHWPWQYDLRSIPWYTVTFSMIMINVIIFLQYINALYISTSDGLKMVYVFNNDSMARFWTFPSFLWDFLVFQDLHCDYI